MPLTIEIRPDDATAWPSSFVDQLSAGCSRELEARLKYEDGSKSDTHDAKAVGEAVVGVIMALASSKLLAEIIAAFRQTRATVNHAKFTFNVEDPDLKVSISAQGLSASQLDRLIDSMSAILGG